MGNSNMAFDFSDDEEEYHAPQQITLNTQQHQLAGGSNINVQQHQASGTEESVRHHGYAQPDPTPDQSRSAQDYAYGTVQAAQYEYAHDGAHLVERERGYSSMAAPSSEPHLESDRQRPLESMFEGYATKDPSILWKRKYEDSVIREEKMNHHITSLQDEVNRLKQHLLTTSSSLQNELRQESERNVQSIQQYESAMTAMAEQMARTEENFQEMKAEHPKRYLSHSSDNQSLADNSDGDNELYHKEVVRLNMLLSEREREVEALKAMTSDEMAALHGQVQKLQELLQTRERENSEVLTKSESPEKSTLANVNCTPVSVEVDE